MEASSKTDSTVAPTKQIMVYVCGGKFRFCKHNL